MDALDSPKGHDSIQKNNLKEKVQKAKLEAKTESKSALGKMFSDVVTGLTDLTDTVKEVLNKGKVLEPFFKNAKEVYAIVRLETYRKGSGDWKKLNKELEKFGITRKNISDFQKITDLYPDGKMGPKTIAKLSTILGAEIKVRYGRKTKRVETPKPPEPKPLVTNKFEPMGPPIPPDLEQRKAADERAKIAESGRPNDDKDAPIDEETADDSYNEPQEIEPNVPDEPPQASDKISLSREQAFISAIKMLSKGNLKSRFLSRSKREEWANVIIDQMTSAGIAINKQNLTIAIVTIDRESGFHEIPVVSNPEKVLDRKIAEFQKENPRVYSLMEGKIADFRARALKFIKDRRKVNLEQGISRSKSDGSRVGYFTEKDIDLAIDYAMQLYDTELPWAVQQLVSKDSLDKYRPKTSGCMQINIEKAIELARKTDGKNYSKAEMRDILNTREGGLRYGMLYLKDILASHKPNGDEMAADDVKFAFLDYNMGAFSTRNAAIQSNLNKLGAKLSVDGDLLRYDNNGQALEKESDTEDAIQDILDENDIPTSDEQIRQDLLKEKSAAFTSTKTYLQLQNIFNSRGATKKNVIPTIKAEGSFAKFGKGKISGAGYVNGSYKRYRNLKSV